MITGLRLQGMQEVQQGQQLLRQLELVTAQHDSWNLTAVTGVQTLLRVQSGVGLVLAGRDTRIVPLCYRLLRTS
jgi:hypothetical protein